MKIWFWPLLIVVALGLSTLPAATAAASADMLYITTTDTTQSVERALQELGYAYDYYYDGAGDWTGIDFTPYDVVIVGLDGGRISQASIQTVRSGVIDAGKRLIFLGGTDWADFALGINQYLVLNDVDDHDWKTADPPQWTLVDADHTLAAGLPTSYNFAEALAGSYATRVTDPDIEAVAVNGDGWPSFFYKSEGFPGEGGSMIAGGDLVWFIDTPLMYYWTDANDYALVKQIIANSLVREHYVYLPLIVR